MFRTASLLAASFLLTAISTGPIAAQMELSLSGKLSTLGAGVEAGVRSGRVGIRGAIHTFGWTYRQRIQSNSSELDLQFRGKSALVDLYLSRGGSFHFSGGVVGSPARFRSTATPSINGRIVVNGKSYTAQQVGDLIGVAEWPDLLPYVGLGWSGSMGGPRVKAVFDIGVAFGSPTFDLTATNATEGSTLESDVAADRARIQSDLESLVPVYPVLSFGLRVRV